MSAFSQVVLNRLPLLCIQQAGLLDTLFSIYERVLVPSALSADVARLEAGSPDGFIERIQVLSPQTPMELGPDWALTEGDREALRLARELGRDTLLVLEGRHHRRVAREHKMPATGTLGVLLFANSKGILGPAEEWLPRVRKAGLLVNPRVAKLVHSLSGKTLT